MVALTAVTRETYEQRAWRRSNGYTFAADKHVVPVFAGELDKLVSRYALGFISHEQQPLLVALLALQPGSNCYVEADGRWRVGYVPAALRAWPFRIAPTPAGDGYVLAFDEDSGLLTEPGQGEPFFNADGSLAPAVQAVGELLAALEQQRRLTNALVVQLRDAGLLEPWPIDFEQEDRRVGVTGVSRVAAGALDRLDPDTWLALRAPGALRLAYAQLFSMEGLARLREWPCASTPPAAPAPATPPGLNLDEDDQVHFDW